MSKQSVIRKAIQRRAMLVRQNGECPLCGRAIKWRAKLLDELPSVDHIIPVSMGGTNHPDNLRIVHHLCNQRRGNRLDAAPWADTPAVIVKALCAGIDEVIAQIEYEQWRAVVRPEMQTEPRPAPRPAPASCGVLAQSETAPEAQASTLPEVLHP